MDEIKKATILEDIMYNEDGSFRPFVGSHGNVDSEIAHYRNTYMEAEKDYFLQLLEDEKIRNYIAELLSSSSPEDIFNEAIAIQERLESGNLETELEREKMQSMTPEVREQYHFEKLIYAEGIMCLLYASIRDKALVLDRVKMWEDSFSNKEDYVRTLR